MDITYVLRITPAQGPNGIELDDATLAEVQEGASPGDSIPAAVRRWLGGKISHAEDALNDGLPDGWNVTVEAVAP